MQLAAAAIAAEKKTGRFAESFSREQLDVLAPALLEDITRHQATFTRRDVERALGDDVAALSLWAIEKFLESCGELLRQPREPGFVNQFDADHVAEVRSILVAK